MHVNAPIAEFAVVRGGTLPGCERKLAERVDGPAAAERGVLVHEVAVLDKGGVGLEGRARVFIEA